MKNTFFLYFFGLFFPLTIYAQPFRHVNRGKAIGVHFYKNIEFLGATFFIGSMAAQADTDALQANTRIKKRDWFAYDLSLYYRFRSFADHPDMKLVSAFGETHGGSDLSQLLTHLAPFPHAVIRPDRDGPWLRPFIRSKDSATSVKEVIDFIEASNRLYKAMDFEACLRDNRILYEKSLLEIRSVLPPAALIKTMEQFYRHAFDHYALLPSLTIPAGMAFGVQHTDGRKIVVMNLFGPFAVQQFKDRAAINMGFADAEHIRELSTHEFGHSFSNPAVLLVSKEKLKATAWIYEPVREAMSNQGYDNWQSCLIEYFVRAGEVVIARKMGNPASANKLLKSYVEQRRFVYLPLFIEQLEAYDRDPSMAYADAVARTVDRLMALPKP
ncbi:DUF4932 domain-containing protein [Paraflavitalea pollutisoli]|uniref:DUF4932 domain-containing protein n=1 Tax=Paraflavitalea pollutisoli TaxID=3034143 RepID=UPI0023ED482A|nr:DUF4932 domain-containing protein [Paraflavitalea sp. H1-2-19X]